MTKLWKLLTLSAATIAVVVTATANASPAAPTVPRGLSVVENELTVFVRQYEQVEATVYLSGCYDIQKYPYGHAVAVEWGPECPDTRVDVAVFGPFNSTERSDRIRPVRPSDIREPTFPNSAQTTRNIPRPSENLSGERVCG